MHSTQGFFFPPPLRLRKLMRVQQTGVSRGQLAEIWAASRRCWGSLKSLGFPAASPSPHHSFTDTRSGHRWSRVQNRSFVYPDGRARAPGTATRLECSHPNKPQAPRSAPAPRLGCKQSDSHPRGQRRGAADAAIITVSPGKPVPGVSPTPYSLPGMCFAFLRLCKPEEEVVRRVNQLFLLRGGPRSKEQGKGEKSGFAGALD